jgi:hypothetical protein
MAEMPVVYPGIGNTFDSSGESSAFLRTAEKGIPDKKTLAKSHVAPGA